MKTQNVNQYSRKKMLLNFNVYTHYCSWLYRSHTLLWKWGLVERPYEILVYKNIYYGCSFRICSEHFFTDLNEARLILYNFRRWLFPQAFLAMFAAYGLRHAMSTLQFRELKVFAISNPMPLFAPVIKHVLLDKSMSFVTCKIQ